jgi:hypothetical protein
MICFNTRCYGKTGLSTAAVDELEFQASLTWLERRRSPLSDLGERSTVRSGWGVDPRPALCAQIRRFGEVGIDWNVLPRSDPRRAGGLGRIDAGVPCGSATVSTGRGGTGGGAGGSGKGHCRPTPDSRWKALPSPKAATHEDRAPDTLIRHGRWWSLIS